MGSGAAVSTALTAQLLRHQTAEAIAHLREQAARIHAGLLPLIPCPSLLREAAGERRAADPQRYPPCA